MSVEASFRHISTASSGTPSSKEPITPQLETFPEWRRALESLSPEATAKALLEEEDRRGAKRSRL